MESIFLSILGSESTGKSYLLTTMAWEFRRVFPQYFGAEFADADPQSNDYLHRYEEGLFQNRRDSQWIPVGSLIEKTELQGSRYDPVQQGDQVILYPRPLLFGVQRIAERADGTAQGRPRLLCFYDNAGEHFRPGADTTQTPVTRHIARAAALFFIFDPTQDTRFRDALGQPRDAGGRPTRQQVILSEAVTRIRRLTGLREGERFDRPLYVILTKSDAWLGLTSLSNVPEPYVPLLGAGSARYGLNVETIEKRSKDLRSFLLTICGDIIMTAEGFAREVTYFGVSSLGSSSRIDPQSGELVVRPRDIAPRWVGVPFLYALSRIAPGLVPVAREAPRSESVGTDPGQASRKGKAR